jgi:tetratricopeptide (TPR) repeat protein
MNYNSSYMHKLLIKITVFVCLFVMIMSCNVFRKSADESDSTDVRTRNFNFNSVLLEAAKQKTLGNFEAALKNYSFAMRIDSEEPVVYYEMAGILSMMGDYSAALDYAKDAVQFDKHNNEYYRILLAELYTANNLLADATNVYEGLLKIRPDNIHYYFDLAELYFSLGNLKRAIRTFNNAEEQFGIMDFISLEKERMYRLSDENKKAIEELEKLSESFPGNVNYMVMLAESYLNNQMMDKALEIFNKVEDMDVENGLIYFSIADFYRIQQDVEKAFFMLRKGFAAQDVDVDTKIKMMITMLSYMGDDKYLFDNAARLMDILLVAYPKDVKVRTLYTDFLIYDEKYLEAQTEFDYILSEEKGIFDLWEQGLFIDNYLMDFKAMYRRSKEAVSFFPNQPVLFLFYAISAFQTENYEDVIQAGKQARTIIVNDDEMLVQILNFKAEAYRKLDNHQKSDEILEILIKINPRDVFVLNNYSYYLSMRGEKLEKALEMSTKLISLDDSKPAFLDTHAWVLYKNGQYDEALIFINRAIDGGGNNAVHYEHKGDILYKLGDKNGALKNWKKALEIGEASDLLEEKIEKNKLIE